MRLTPDDHAERAEEILFEGEGNLLRASIHAQLAAIGYAKRTLQTAEQLISGTTTAGPSTVEDIRD